MKVFSNTFREALREDRQLNAIVSYRSSQAFNVLTTQDDKNLMTENNDFLVTEKGFLNYDKESINSINPLFNTSLFKTTCKSVQIDSINKIEKGTWVNIKIGVYKEDTNNYEYLDFGNYYVNEEPTYQADTNSYLTTAYDKMIESMKSYDENILSIEFPITHKDFVVAICNKFDWGYDLIDYPNCNKNIVQDFYKGQNLTYRDVLDDLNGVCGGSFMFNLDNKLIWKRPIETNEIVEDNDLKDINVDFKEKFGKVNALTITTNSNVVLDSKEDSQSIQENGKTEFNINDNYILNYSTDDFIDEIFDEINGLEYYLYDIDSTGLLIFEPLDVFTFRHDGVNYKTIMFNDDIKLTQGLIETTYAEKPDEVEKDYKTTDKAENKLNNAIISLDKANAEIVLKVDSNGRIAQARLDGNADNGTLFEVKADNIKLEGYTTINKDFKVTDNGSIIVKNGLFSGKIQGSILELEDNGTLNNAPITIKYGNDQLTRLGSNGIEHYTDDYIFVVGNQTVSTPMGETEIKILTLKTKNNNSIFEVILDSSNEYGSGVIFKNNGKVLLNLNEDNMLYTSRTVYQSDGEADTINLDISVQTCYKIDVYYSDNNGKECGTQTIFDPQGETFTISSLEINGASGGFIRSSEYIITGSQIIPVTAKCGYFKNTNGSWTTVSGINYLRIKKVVAYFNNY